MSGSGNWREYIWASAMALLACERFVLLIFICWRYSKWAQLLLDHSIESHFTSVSCKAGEYRSESMERCAACSGNSYSYEGAPSCTPCTEGRHVNEDKTDCGELIVRLLVTCQEIRVVICIYWSHLDQSCPYTILVLLFNKNCARNSWSQTAARFPSTQLNF
jgi:hypothetical protein